MSPERYIFRRKNRWYSSPFAIFSLMVLILGGLLVTQGFQRGDVKPLFLPTPTPTRIADSYILEAQTQFNAGNLDAAIRSYQDAIQVNPKNGRLYAELARILTYSTESQTTAAAKQERFTQAMDAAKNAVTLAPDDSTAFAVQAFTLDWYASFLTFIQKDEKQGSKLLTEADQAASKAITLDETNVLAQVYRAEIMIDQQNYDQAKNMLSAALQRDPKLWDAHRVKGLFLESQAYYLDSIEEFKQAVELAPNMSFLYIKLGMSYRNLAMNTNNEILFNEALTYFDKAAALNGQLGIQDPLPYLGLGRTYSQLGQFYAASRNMNKAIQLNPSDQEVYAQLGMVYRQARNYEDAITALHCAVRGCKADDTCALRQCNPDVDAPIIFSAGMPLSGQTVVYYYTYASLLAGMYLPRDPKRSTYCTESADVTRELRASSYGSDQTITSILDESANICTANLANSAGPTAIPTATPQGTRGPAPTRGPTPTPTPKPAGM